MLPKRNRLSRKNSVLGATRLFSVYFPESNGALYSREESREYINRHLGEEKGRQDRGGVGQGGAVLPVP